MGSFFTDAELRTNPPWEEAWQGMPEFKMEDLTPIKSVMVHFASWEDSERFAELIGQTVTPKTKSVWYPEAEIGRYVTRRYVDTEPELERAPNES